MIRINLLGLKKEIKKSAMAMPTVSLQGTMLATAAIAIAALGFVWVGYRYYELDKETTATEAAIKKENDEARRLAAVKASVDAMEADKKKLAKQIEVIQALENGRTGPIEMLYALANTVVTTKTMWLTSFDNTGNKITISGEATSVNTVADFMENLKSTGRFTNIEIKETSQDEKYKDIQAFIFEMSADIVTPGAPASATAQGKGK